MGKRGQKKRKLAGAIPYRIETGKLEFCLVSSARRADAYVLPKGRCMRGEHAMGAARRECYEEAGLKGKIRAPRAPIIWHEGRASEIVYYLMPIRKICEDWPEKESRTRLWVDADGLGALDLRKRERRVLEAAIAHSALYTPARFVSLFWSPHPILGGTK